jgi:hypothetical protein
MFLNSSTVLPKFILESGFKYLSTSPKSTLLLALNLPTKPLEAFTPSLIP